MSGVSHFHHLCLLLYKLFNNYEYYNNDVKNKIDGGDLIWSWWVSIKALVVVVGASNWVCITASYIHMYIRTYSMYICMVCMWCILFFRNSSTFPSHFRPKLYDPLLDSNLPKSITAGFSIYSRKKLSSPVFFISILILYNEH